ncbi:MAG TPA: hypothetical protein VNB49_18775, partial [Candidatus Dormibacteraeota bacterium]|nr:hypothetical protein [Candidatus Dormibacteraeota bacterium]
MTKLTVTKFLLLLAIGVGGISFRMTAQNAPSFIPATAAFDSPGCSTNLSAVTPAPQANPEWKVIILPGDAERLMMDIHSLPQLSPTILEGFVATPPPACRLNPGVELCEGPNDQMTSEVSEEDIPWNHYTHDFTFKVVPDAPYQRLLSSWVNRDGTTGVHTDMEVEWDNASAMDVHDDLDRVWGGAPEFVWPAVGDRVWVEGRWIFDCGHPNSSDRRFVQFSTEIHPPRALVAFRLNHPALFDTVTVKPVTFYRSIYPASWLPVSGGPVPGQPGPTNVPVTEADIFVSGNGGGANDLCMIVPTNPDNDCQYGHSSPVIQVNDRNYVFEIY